MKFDEMYNINRKFKRGDGGIYNPKYLDDAIVKGNLPYALLIAHTNIEILLRYMYLYGKVAIDRSITHKDMNKASNPMFAELCKKCKFMIGDELYGKIMKFNRLRTNIHTIVVLHQLEKDKEKYYEEIKKSKKYCEELFSLFFNFLQERNKRTN